jgi:hypothetical protein
MVKAGATVILLTNDQDAYDQPPPGAANTLLKSRTTPAELSRSIGELIPAPLRTRSRS